MSRTLIKKTTYPSTVSWRKKDYERQVLSDDYDIVIAIDKNTGARLGSATIEEIRNSAHESFTKGSRPRRIVVADFRRG